VNAVRRVVEGECAASGSPKAPHFELYDHFPVTTNDAAATATVAAAFSQQFGEHAFTIDRQSASEDFSEIPDALGVPYTYWGIGGVDPELYARAEAAGTLSTDIPTNHSPNFAPVIEPTLATGTAAAVTAAFAWLGNDR
jgi:hippurate hydrolase